MADHINITGRVTIEGLEVLRLTLNVVKAARELHKQCRCMEEGLAAWRGLNDAIEQLDKEAPDAALVSIDQHSEPFRLGQEEMRTRIALKANDLARWIRETPLQEMDESPRPHCAGPGAF